MKKNQYLPALFLLSLIAGGCSNTKEQLGLSRKAPDEFAVIKHAPLSMPPDYNLRPPQPGAARPQEQATSEQAKQAIFGTGRTAGAEGATADSAEGTLLMQAGGQSADPAIRNKVDAETKEQKDANKPVVKKLLGIVGQNGPDSASVVNAKEETERLRKNADEGKPVTTGETPSIEQ